MTIRPTGKENYTYGPAYRERIRVLSDCTAVVITVVRVDAGTM